MPSKLRGGDTVEDYMQNFGIIHNGTTITGGGTGMAPASIAGSVREFILRQFPLARKHQIKNSDPLLESGTLDSMGVLEVVTFIEQQYSICVSDDDLVPEHFQSIDRIAGFIAGKVNGKGAASA